MHAAERHRELVAHLAAERTPLREAQMMRVDGLAAADQAGQLGHEPQMLFVAIAFWLGQREDAVVTARRMTIAGQYLGKRVRRRPNLINFIGAHRLPDGIGGGEV